LKTSLLEKIADAEKNHEIRYAKLVANVENESVFNKNAPTQWKCLKCGYIHTGEAAPEKCPACLHPQGYFELFAETY
jgi:rubrerythrin